MIYKDLVFAKTSAHSLKEEMTIESIHNEVKVSSDKKVFLAFVVDQISNLYKQSERACILVS